MDVAHWTEPGVDTLRARRLAVGFVAGASMLGGVVAFLALSAPPPVVAEEDAVEVVFGELPPEEEELAPEPEPEPEPEPPPDVIGAVQGPARMGPRSVPIDVAPTAVPTTETEEKAPEPGMLNPGADPNQNPGGGGTAKNGSLTPVTPVTPPPAPEPPAPPPPKPTPKKKPSRVTEGMTPPKKISGASPVFPASAQGQGIEGVVVVTFVVTATGAVTQVKAVRGPAALRAACVAAVMGWRFQPALDANGNPIAVSRAQPFRMKITTH